MTTEGTEMTKKGTLVDRVYRGTPRRTEPLIMRDSPAGDEFGHIVAYGGAAVIGQAGSSMYSLLRIFVESSCDPEKGVELFAMHFGLQKKARPEDYRGLEENIDRVGRDIINRAMQEFSRKE